MCHLLLTAAVLFAIAVGFYENMQRQMEAIHNEVVQQDQTGKLVSVEEDRMFCRIRTFRKTYGTTLSIGVQGEPFASVPVPDSKNDPYMMLWLSPQHGEVLLAMSPPVRISIGDAFARSFERGMV